MTQPGTTRESFFLLYSRLLELRCGATALRFLDDGVLAAEGRNGRSVTAYLDNLWLLAGGGKDRGEEAIEGYLRAFAAATLGQAVDCAAILPAVRDERYIRLLGESSDLACRHLAADLWVVYVADSETSMQSLAWSQFEETGLRREDVEAVALGNLRQSLPEVDCLGEGPSYRLTAGADYTSSLLLVDEVWEAAAEQVQGDLVAVTPSRDVVLFTGSASAPGLAEIRARALDLFAHGDHTVSSTLLRRVRGGWKAFE